MFVRLYPGFIVALEEQVDGSVPEEGDSKFVILFELHRSQRRQLDLLHIRGDSDCLLRLNQHKLMHHPQTTTVADSHMQICSDNSTWLRLIRFYFMPPKQQRLQQRYNLHTQPSVSHNNATHTHPQPSLSHKKNYIDCLFVYFTYSHFDSCHCLVMWFIGCQTHMIINIQTKEGTSEVCLPGQVVEGSHPETGHHCLFPLLGQNPVPCRFFMSLWVLHLKTNSEISFAYKPTENP